MASNDGITEHLNHPTSLLCKCFKTNNIYTLTSPLSTNNPPTTYKSFPYIFIFLQYPVIFHYEYVNKQMSILLTRYVRE